MCGRYVLENPEAVIRELFGVQPPFTLPRRFNIAPTQQAPLARGTDREIVNMRWGLIPRWAKDPSIGNRLINARAETAAEKPSFREALRRRRCLVPADGFYEWKKEPDGKQPWLIRRTGGRGFALGGLWECWHGPEGPVESFTILTTAPNATVGALHDRMPVIVPPAAFDVWLDPGAKDPTLLENILRPAPDDLLEAYPVSRLVNSPANDEPACIEPLP